MLGAVRRVLFAIFLATGLAIGLAISSLLLTISRAGAAQGPRIVVLAFVTSDEELVIYGKPVADAVARGLAGLGELSVGGAADASVAKADLVVELRVIRARGKVRVEAIVRDAEVGQSQSRVSARPVALGDLDQAATELARALTRLVSDATTGRSKRQSDEKAAVKAIPAATPTAAAPPLRQPDFRPAILVFQPTGEVAGGAVDVRDVTLAAIDRLVAQEGFRAILATRTGFVAPDEAAREAGAAHARATVMTRVHDVEFSWTGVLTARGSVHFVVVAPDGRLLMNRDVETDTLVGSRGDRHDALVRFVVAQAFDIARKELVAAIR